MLAGLMVSADPAEAMEVRMLMRVASAVMLAALAQSTSRSPAAAVVSTPRSVCAAVLMALSAVSLQNSVVV